MVYLKTITILCLLMFACGITVSANEQERASPKLFAPVVVPGGDVIGCPSDEDRQAALDLVSSMSEQFVQNYTVNPNCGPGLWRQVFYLNTSSQDQSCPGDWNLHTVSSVRGCTGAGASCQSAYSDEIGYEYSTVCGRVVGIGTVTPDAFFRFISGQTTIEGIYLDGVSVTHGAPGSRKHIWSFGAGHPPPVARCPCENPNRTEAPLPPFKVEQNYFCSSTYPEDHLWSGSDCNSASSCCSFHNPPYFSVQLPSPTSDQIELRICSDQYLDNEVALVIFAEIYVQ